MSTGKLEKTKHGVLYSNSEDMRMNKNRLFVVDPAGILKVFNMLMYSDSLRGEYII